MRVIQERNINGVPTVAYTRGPDLSGTLEGAGGIGGLLARTAHSGANGVTLTTAFYHADGNGNVTYLLKLDQTVGATYQFDPYGRLLTSSGTLAAGNTYRFSSKELMLASGLYYYGYRFYDPNTQKWLNRDPILERGGMNLYRFIGNNSINGVDFYGLAPNQEGTCNAQHVEDFLRENPNLGDLSSEHDENTDRYFYTDKYGWVDIRHFGRAAELIQEGWPKMIVDGLGFSTEVVQWLQEWGDDYRSGFSPEDIPSNSAGANFGQSIGPGENVADAFNRWARKNGARDQNDPRAGWEEAQIVGQVHLEVGLVADQNLVQTE